METKELRASISRQLQKLDKQELLDLNSQLAARNLFAALYGKEALHRRMAGDSAK